MTEKNTHTPELAETSEHRLNFEELMAFDNEELLTVSRAFGEYYRGLVEPVQSPSEVDGPIIDLGLEGASSGAQQVTASVVAAQSRKHEELYGVPNVHGTSEVPPDFQGVVETGPFGIPIVMSSLSELERAFGKKQSASFCASDYMIEAGKLPVVFTAEPEGPARDEAVRHELSHAVYALLRHAGALSGGAQEYQGIAAVTLLAKDEAIAQMVAGQNKTTHPNVVRALRSLYGDDSSIVHRYRDDLRDTFNKGRLKGTDVNMQDGILIATLATTIEELVEGLGRLGAIAQSERRDDSGDTLAPTESDWIGWNAA